MGCGAQKPHGGGGAGAALQSLGSGRVLTQWSIQSGRHSMSHWGGAMGTSHGVRHGMHKNKHTNPRELHAVSAPEATHILTCGVFVAQGHPAKGVRRRLKPIWHVVHLVQGCVWPEGGVPPSFSIGVPRGPTVQ